MKILTSDLWTSRYKAVLKQGVIEQRATVRGVALNDLGAMETEVACLAMQDGFKSVFMPTERICEIIRREVERALAHASKVYADPKAALRAIYSDFQQVEPYMPTLISGPAGSGKTQLRLAIGRVLNGCSELWIDESHPRVPLLDYAHCVIGNQRSITGVLRSLARPEIAQGKARLTQPEMPAECARWQRFCGVCLLGVDEMQFMTQSENSSVLVTRTMLAIAEIQLPWFVIANYSLGWKLMSRPAEATQRLLGNPTLLLPDPPNSNDWKLLLKEYQVVAADAFAFKLLDHANDLWNLSAGLKRELVKLLVLSYRISRRCGEKQVIWPHVVSAFSSVEFSVSRRDINLLVAHAAQGGDLRKDLNCPFSGTDIQSQRQAYEEELRKARAAVVANEVIKSAMTMSEKKAIEGIASQSSPTGSVQTNHSRKRSRRTLEDLQTAGRKANERRKSLKTDDIIRPSS